MVNLGIDFGSTYTMVSVFENGMPVTVQPNHLTYNYPSVVAYDKRKKSTFSECRQGISSANRVLSVSEVLKCSLISRWVTLTSKKEIMKI